MPGDFEADDLEEDHGGDGHQGDGEPEGEVAQRKRALDRAQERKGAHLRGQELDDEDGHDGNEGDAEDLSHAGAPFERGADMGARIKGALGKRSRSAPGGHPC